MERYPLCRIEAFVESIQHLQNVSERRIIVNEFVASQGDGKYVKEFVRGIKVKKEGDVARMERDADGLLNAFKGGFKGLD